MTARRRRGDGGRARTPLYVALPARLRVVLVTPARVPKWLSVFVAGASGGGAVDLQVLVCGDEPPARRSRLPWDLSLFLGIERLLTRVLGRVTGRREVGSLAMVSLADPPAGAVVADPLEAQERLRALAPDLVLLHGALEHAGALAATARLGCWVLDPDLVDPGRAGLSLLAPILERDDATRIALHLAPAGPGVDAREVAASVGATSAMSFSQQRDIAFAKLPALLARALRGLVDPPAPGRHLVQVLRVTPASFEAVPGMGLRSLRVAVGQFMAWGERRRRARLPWFLVVPERSPLDPAAPVLDRYLGLVAPGHDYWADPFPVQVDGRRLVFVEELVHAKGKGVIACLELHADGTAARLGMVLEEDAHLSYPQVFQWDGQWYMTVESCEAGRVSLYVAEAFPLQWRRVANLVEGRAAVDPTLHHHDGRWYLFANVSESGSSLSDELFLFVSDCLAGPYRPHPANPIVCDARTSRPAGRLFRREGRLLRPAQCCVPIYGTAVVFNEVLELGPDAYRERPLATLGMDGAPGVDGCHTYNAWGDFEVLDAHGRPPPPAARMPVVVPDMERATH